MSRPKDHVWLDLVKNAGVRSKSDWMISRFDNLYADGTNCWFLCHGQISDMLLPTFDLVSDHLCTLPSILGAGLVWFDQVDEAEMDQAASPHKTNSAWIKNYQHYCRCLGILRCSSSSISFFLWKWGATSFNHWGLIGRHDLIYSLVVWTNSK